MLDVHSVTTQGTANNGAIGLFSLQLNTKPTSSPACAHAAVPANCSVWLQLLFTNSPVHAYVYLEYWLIGYDAPCPGSETTPPLPGVPEGTQWAVYEGSCFFDSPSVQLPGQNIASLNSITLRGSADPQGLDQVTVQLPDGSISGEALPDSIFNLGTVWQAAEFNVFGYHGGEEIVFNKGAALVVQLKVENNAAYAPIPIREGYTGETNNLDLGAVECAVPGDPPTLRFEEVSSPAQLSGICPLKPKPISTPPYTLCQSLENGVTAAQGALTRAQAELSKPTCKGTNSINCERQVQAAQQELVAAEATYKKSCSK